MKISPPELSIRDGSNAGVYLFLDDFGDFLVFDLAEFGGGDGFIGGFYAGFFYGGGAEEGSYVVCAVETWGERHFCDGAFVLWGFDLGLEGLF